MIVSKGLADLCSLLASSCSLLQKGTVLITGTLRGGPGSGQPSFAHASGTINQHVLDITATLFGATEAPCLPLPCLPTHLYSCCHMRICGRRSAGPVPSPHTLQHRPGREHLCKHRATNGWYTWAMQISWLCRSELWAPDGWACPPSSMQAQGWRGNHCTIIEARSAVLRAGTSAL